MRATVFLPPAGSGLPQRPAPPKRTGRKRPPLCALLLALILSGCLFFPLAAGGDPAYLDLPNANTAPCRAFPFGTDSLGRDIFLMIWYGGRVSLFIGLAASAISAAVAIGFGALSGVAPAWADALFMRLTEILLSIPNLLLSVLLQAAFGRAGIGSLSAVIGLTSWMGMAKVVRAEVRQLRGSEYILAAKCLGAGFFRLLFRHLAPNSIPSILFMAVMNIRSAIAAEATLSFMGMGLPLETVSWGSMLSLAGQALTGGNWWTILIPGAFLILTLACITGLGNRLRGQGQQRHSNL